MSKVLNKNFIQSGNQSSLMHHMEHIIGDINKIQDIFHNLDIPNSIQLPQIVMIGSQSTGKSSVLESLVHRPFLPRGDGIVTRCPLVLQLIEYKLNDSNFQKSKNKSMDVKEWGEFLHLKDEIFTDFDEIRREILRRTDELAGTNKGICNKPIHLKIFSPHVVTLTLVDLPGITKVPFGDQPKDIEEQVTELVLEYIKNKNSIILSVSAANTDITNSDGLKFARMVDPEGLRTLAILTKIDIMNPGTDAWDMLNGNIIAVKLGYVGVINRSQKDIQDGKDIDAQLRYEKEYFEQNYNAIADHNGVPYLAQRLSRLLMNHISKCLPELKIEISKKLDDQKNIFKQFVIVKDRDVFLINAVTKFNKNFSSTIAGTCIDRAKDLKNLFGGPKIRYIFDKTFVESLQQIKAEITKDDITKYVLTTGGPRLSVFGPEFLIQELLNQQIERLRIPSTSCADEIFNEVRKIIHQLIKDQVELSQFPTLEREMLKIMEDLLNECLPEGKKLINELINVELSSINTNHPDLPLEDILYFESERHFLENLKSKKSKTEATTIELFIMNYFAIVKKTVQDQVPKIIIHKIINHMKNNMQTRLFCKLDGNKDDLFKESEEIVKCRENAGKMIEALRIAKDTIEQIEADM